ncbi:MAG: ABC transporter ATP-binding protein [Oscillatoriales cyanobacterium SM2_2_1]|nr:ABC transporter ATP-binding protein [Oscillatoriales cyanobacterium SM2_2_1]
MSILQTLNLTKQFDRQLAVNGVNLTIEAGEIYGLIGPNGAGKTTLIRMLTAVDEPTAGEILIHGQRFRPGDRDPELKRQLGYVPDDYPLYDELTVWDYLDYFARLYLLTGAPRRQRLEEVLSMVELTEKRDSLIATLSRGMRQRLSLARSIIHRPALLFLDEPVSGLDPVARVMVRNIIKRLQQDGTTVLVSSHILSDLEEVCSSIGIMELGRLVESSRLQEVYSRLAKQQVLIGVVDGLERLRQVLAEHPLVQGTELVLATGLLRVDFGGDAQAAADLLRSLVTAGLPVCEFHQTKENLEEIFFKMGYQRTS